MESGNDYVIQVKGNQKNLRNNVQEYTLREKPTDHYRSIDRIRDRTDYRDVTIYNLKSSHLHTFSSWNGLNTIIHIHRYGNRGKKNYNNDKYYISSLTENSAKVYAEGIRDHWSIENRLHWVKDAILNEDDNQITTGSIATNISLLKSIMMNVFRIRGFDSIKYAMETFANRPKEALLLINELCI